MTRRREFLKAAAGVSAARADARIGSAGRGVALARELVRQGELGAIRFCRIAHAGLRERAGYVLSQADCVIEIQPGTEGAAFLGSRGTLVVCGREWRVFGREW